MESSDDAIISKTLDGTITSWNRAAEKIYGYRPDEVIGQPASILAPIDRDDEPTILERIASGQSIEQYETIRRTKDGQTIDVALTVSPIKDAEAGSSARPRSPGMSASASGRRSSAKPLVRPPIGRTEPRASSCPG